MSDVSAAVGRGMAVVDAYEKRSHAIPRGPLEGPRCPCCQQPAHFEKPTIFLDQNTLSFRDKTLKLTRTTAEILSVLAEQMPRTVSYGVMTDRVWGVLDDQDHFNTIQVFLVRLRRELKPLGIKIETIRGTGWRMVIDS